MVELWVGRLRTRASSVVIMSLYISQNSDGIDKPKNQAYRGGPCRQDDCLAGFKRRHPVHKDDSVPSAALIPTGMESVYGYRKRQIPCHRPVVRRVHCAG